MVFYVVVFSACVAMMLLNNTTSNPSGKNTLAIVTLIGLTVVSGTRYELGGGDYFNYQAVFNSMPRLPDFVHDFGQLDYLYVTDGFERGYLAFNSLVKTLGFNFYGFTLIEATIFYTCLYIGLRRYAWNFNLVIVVFLCRLFFYDTFISLRQSMTIAIFFLAMDFIRRKRLVPYYLACFLALSLHSASLILFFLYPLAYFRLTRRRIAQLAAIFIPTLLVRFLGVPILHYFGFLRIFLATDSSTAKLDNVLAVTAGEPLGIFYVLEYFLMMAIVLFLYHQFVDHDDDKTTLILKLFICLLPIMTLLSGTEAITRLKDYFLLSYALILDRICLAAGGKYRFLTQLAIILVNGIWFFRFLVLFDSGGMIPYQSFLGQGLSIFGT